ncbi:hypothetical protein [Winogradskyella sp.]|uniref:hypothetical protein n=1 Tax=Winogradskyella sp. TaxID=1883156 RepID=UPI001B2EAD34|nr:hypothetical protein [Winogradskyella sp.]MBO6879982.1 hypothetical protein [Winogradskyella sp.]
MKKKYSLIFLAFLCALMSSFGQVNTGDLAFVQYNADGAEVIKLLVFADIAAGESIDITDNGWLNSGSFRGGEGVFNYTVPAGGHSCGDIVTIDLSNVALSGSGDQLIVYQGSTMITAINSEGAGVWQADATNANTSALPTGLTNGTNAIALNEIDNAMYNGILTGDIATLRAAIHNNSNWIGDNTAIQDFTSTFAISDCGGSSTCSITDILLSNSSSCNDNGSASNASDDYYTSDVTITYSNAPASGTIDLTGTGVIGGTTSVAIGTSPQTITGVQLAANGADVEIIATFSAETTCNYTETVAGSGVASCSAAASTNCAFESFDNSNATGSYSDNSFTGDNGVTWTYVESRDENGDANGSGINGNALMLRRSSDNSSVTSSLVPNGIGDFSVKLYKGFTGSGNRQVELFVNGISQGTSTPFDDFNEHIFSVSGINIAGDITVEIRNITGSQVIVDEIEWTCYSACTPPADPTGTISGATPICAASTTLSFSGSAPADVVYYWQNSSLGEDQTNDAASNLTVTTSGDYYVRAYNTVESCWSDGEVGPYSVSVTTSAPIINSQPSDLTAAVGGSVSYTVVSPNTASYQWQVSTNGGSTWSNVGTDSSSLTITNVQLTDDGNLYQVILTNACGSTTSNTATLTVTTSTLFNPGELIFVGFDGQINGSGSNDEFLIATLVDITNGTEFSIVNSRYEAGAAANVRTEKWGGGSDDPSEAPFETKITYTGSSVIPAGSVLRFEITTSNTFVVFATVTEGTTTTTSTSDFTVNVVNAGSYANISTSGDDQLYLMQGDFVSDGSIDANEANYLFTGTLLHGITIGTSWVPLTSACSGNTSTRESRLPPELRCFNVESISSIRGYYENDKEHGLATIRVIVNNVSDNSSNWDLTSYNFDPTDDTASSGGKTFLINPSNPAGQWVGDVDTNWFNCANWEGLAVPKSTTNVEIDNTAMNIAQIDYTASFSDDFSDIATCNNLIISGSSVDLSGNNANILEVNGNLIIDGMGTGSLNMDDGNNATADGLLYLSGNWTNELTDAAFLEGNGTVIFKGANPQTITYGGPPIPPGPFESEIFYNVVLDNDFDIATTDRTFIMSGNLTVNPGRTLNVQSGQLIEVGNMVTNLGSFTLQDSASLIQVNDVTNVGNLTMNRDYIVDSSYDYVYWSSPITDFNTDDLPINNGHIYKWNPTATNTGSGQGNWESAASEIMQEGIGYIARVPSTVPATLVFQNGVPNNGDVNLNLSRGLNPASEDDDWNLVGNPYPSSISALAFLNANTNLEGFVNLWTHGADPSLLEPDPFYEDYVYNYNEDDYITYNGTATTNGPSGFSGYIAAGQSFMVNTVNGLPSTTIAMSFENSMRQRDYDNSNFYRLNPQLTSKHRIWLDFGMSDEPVGKRIVIGYVPNATMEEDRLYDAKWIGDETEQRFYSILNESDYLIQGRALPFSDEDVVPVGFNAIIAGNYTIAISAVDGVFDEGNQDIFIKDNLLGLVHNLSSNPYSFNSEVGEFNDRFEIVFRADALSIDDNQLDDNDLSIVEQSNGDVRFSIGKNLTITTVEILDVLGRQVYNLKGNSSVEVYDLSRLSNTAYIAKVTLSNGQVISKKAIKRK